MNAIVPGIGQTQMTADALSRERVAAAWQQAVPFGMVGLGIDKRR